MPGVEEAERSSQLADEAYARFEVDAVVAHLSAAIRGFTAAGDACRAAMVCVRLGDVLANAMGNVIAGHAWFARARRLVEDQPPCVEQGWVAIAAMGCDVDDPAKLLAAAELALDRARRFGDLNLETKALADAGLAHVQVGRIADGMALLDEAMALVCGPADDNSAAAKSVCSFFTACYYVADFARAGSWATLLRQHGLIGAAPGPQAFLSSHCDSVHATLLMELGRWGEAEAVLLRAKADFESVMGAPSWHPDIALADLRIRQGRHADAEALLVGKDQVMQALLPAARLHLARGDADLARSAAARGVRLMGDDRVRAVELLAVAVDAELARGDLEAAQRAASAMVDRVANVDVPTLHARTAVARAHVAVAAGDPAAAIASLESAVELLDARQLPWLRTTLQLELARLHETTGDRRAAGEIARAADRALASLDVALPAADAALLERLRATPAKQSAPGHPPAELVRQGKWWIASYGGSSVRLQDTKGLRYLAELIARPGAERHALDLVDCVEGVDAVGGLDRRALGDAGEVLDTRARRAYRHRIEQLRADAADALAAGQLESAEALQGELEHLVRQLALAFGLGGRDRRAASAAERARLNVTRALRAATTKLAEVMPGPGGALDRAVRTGLYCAYEPPPTGEVRWIVQSELNGPARR